MVIAAAPAVAVAYLALALVLNLLPVLQVWLTRQVVNGLVAHAGALALRYTMLYGLAFLVPAALQPVQDTLMAWLEDRAWAEADGRLMQAGTRIPDLRRIESPTYGDELLHVQDGAGRAPRLVPVLPGLLGSLVALAGLMLLVARLTPVIPLALVAATSLHVLSQRRVNRLKYESLTGRSRPAREMEYALRVMTDPAAAKELRIFGQGGFFLARYRDRLRQVLFESDRSRRAELRLSALSTGLQALALAGGFWYVAVQAGAGRLTLGDVALYLAAVAQTESRLFTMAMQYGVLSGILLHLGSFFRFVDGAGPSIAIAPADEARPARRDVPLPRQRHAGARPHDHHSPRRYGDSAGRRQRRRQEHHRQAAHADVRPGRRGHPSRRTAARRL